MPFERTFAVSWAHLDANDHMANTAFINLAIDVRFLYFESRGFSPAEFRRAGVGPVVRRDEVDYFRELHFMQQVAIDLRLAGLSEDCSRFRLVNEFRRPDGELCARLTTQGGWLDLKARRLVAPPDGLAAALRALDRTAEFETLKSSVKS